MLNFENFEKVESKDKGSDLGMKNKQGQSKDKNISPSLLFNAFHLLT